MVFWGYTLACCSVRSLMCVAARRPRTYELIPLHRSGREVFVATDYFPHTSQPDVFVRVLTSRKGNHVFNDLAHRKRLV
jgi:hypothetical protein